jgi:RND family efflux transporter MFP subunit
VPARARIGGTVVALAVKHGDAVKQGEVVATVGDEKLALQLKSLDAQIAGLEAQFSQTQADLTRAQDLFSRGTIPRTRLDEAQTAFNIASNALKARTAERSVLQQQVTEGNVLAPTSGRVLKVPVTTGTVILPGEPVANIAVQDFILRLRVPERHAGFLKAGDTVSIDGEAFGVGKAKFGTIRLVYPQIEDGRVIADAAVANLGDYFVGERIRVWVSSGERGSITVPASYIITRFGIDYARVRKERQNHDRCTGTAGARPATARHAGCIRNPFRTEGRRCVGEAVNLGLSGHLTQATIRSPLTPLFLLAALAIGLLALLTIAREEEPQISVPMVDIRVNADGLKAPDAVELVTKPLEAIIKGIDGVEHVYSQT